MDNMKNIAYTREYLEKFSDAYNKTLTPGCTIEEERRDLGNGISVLSKTSRYIYYRENSQFETHLSGSENIIFRGGKEIFSFKTIDDESRCKIFTHQNGLILWNGTGLFPERDENAERKIISSDEYMAWFKKDNNK